MAAADDAGLADHNSGNSRRKGSGPLLDEHQMVTAPQRTSQVDCNAAFFVAEVAAKLTLDQTVICLALSYLHRYRAQNGVSFKDGEERDFLASACIFVAAKVLEHPRKIRDVLNTAQSVRCSMRRSGFGAVSAGTGDSVKGKHGGIELPLSLNKEYWLLKNKLVETEQRLLRSLGFDIEPDRAHLYLANYLHSLRLYGEPARIAWAVLNDTYLTPQCLNHSPCSLAAGAIYIALKLLKYTSPETEDVPAQWWTLLGVETEELRAICHGLMDFWGSGGSRGCSSDDSAAAASIS